MYINTDIFFIYNLQQNNFIRKIDYNNNNTKNKTNDEGRWKSKWFKKKRGKYAEF
jgi:hypothetical protein